MARGNFLGLKVIGSREFPLNLKIKLRNFEQFGAVEAAN